MRANHNCLAWGRKTIRLWCMVQSYKNESKSQPKRNYPYVVCAVMYGTKLQKWEQITTSWVTQQNKQTLWCMVQSYKNESKSQREARERQRAGAVMYGTKLQKWEQITTIMLLSPHATPLWCMVQSYKNESKSQHYHKPILPPFCCDVWYKVTKMRANHNGKRSAAYEGYAVMYGTKLQKWEQITTGLVTARYFFVLWCMVQSYKNESKSQLTGRDNFVWLVLWCMVQSYKNESKSQLSRTPHSAKKSCDVWYKVTKMRANHNFSPPSYAVNLLWCMVQSYKNESKSQHQALYSSTWYGCDVWYKVTKMRANHNCARPKPK